MQIVIDVSSWTQTEKNYLQAAAVSLLYAYDNKFGGQGIYAKNGIIIIDDSLNPPPEVKDVLSATNLKTFIEVELEKTRIASETAQIEAKARETEIASNELTNIKLVDIDIWIDTQVDAITNLADAKVFLKKFLKKLAKYIVARS